MDYLIEHFEHLAAGFGTAVALATIITKLTPTKKDDYFLAKLVNIFSLIKKSK